MKYRLGLDVGTASVGLVALQLDEKNQPVKPVYQSVRIFNEPMLPAKKGGIGEPRKAARRLARQQRKGRQRSSRRLKRIAELGRLMGLEPDAILADKGQHIHKVRAQAAVAEVSLEDLLRIFLKMGKRRGYYGDFKANKDDDRGQVESGIHSLRTEMEESGCDTLGQYLWGRIKDGRHLRLKDDGLFADRQMVEDEFSRIWKTQEKYHSILKNNYGGIPVREHFHRAIIQQRPHKSPAAFVGNCLLESMLPRAPMAQPAMQAFRIEKQIADLRWGTSRNAPPLSYEQRDVIRNRLQKNREVKMADLYKLLHRAGCPGPEGRELNLVGGDRETLTGDRTAAAMKRMKLSDEWNDLAENHQVSVINLLADMGSPDVFDTPDWHEKLRKAKANASDPPEKQFRRIMPQVRDFINKMLATGKFDRLSKMGLDGGRSSYSIKALKQILAVMQEQEKDEHGAIDIVYPGFHNTEQVQNRSNLLERYITGNTVVDVALGQVRREINAVIARLEAVPSEIIIEFSRDMKTGLHSRNKITDSMRRNEQNRKRAAQEIREHTGKEASQSQITRYLLWTEQGQEYCPYCDEQIGIGGAIDGNITEYEQIIPQSLTRIGKKRDYLVLAHKACNQEKKNMTPWQAWGHDKERWNIIENRAKKFEEGYKILIRGNERPFKHKGKARQLLIKDFEADALDNEAVADFTDRQFHETAWVARACGKWLRSICSNVRVSRGLLTARLRRVWGLDTVIPEVRYEEGMRVFDENYQPDKGESTQLDCMVTKDDFDKYRRYWEGHHVEKEHRTPRRLNKRIDHRHHLIDALVIALTTPGLYQRMAVHYGQVTDSGGNNLRLYAEPELKDIRNKALELVRNCRPSHRPDRWLSGNMFKDNPGTIIQEDGRSFYLQRKKLTELKPGDIDNIFPVSTRMVIRTELERRIATGDTPDQALKKQILHPYWKTPIRRVSIRGNSAEGAVRIEHGDRINGLYKHLIPSEYAYLEYKAGDPDSEPRLVRLHDALKSETAGPVLQNITRLYKGDTVYDSFYDKQYVIRQIKADGPRLMLSPITEALTDIGKVIGSRRITVSGNQIRRLVLVNDVFSPEK